MHTHRTRGKCQFKIYTFEVCSGGSSLSDACVRVAYRAQALGIADNDDDDDDVFFLFTFIFLVG